MSVIFGLYTQVIYVHMTIYRNLTTNITKSQKRVNKGSKICQEMVKIKNAHRNTIYEKSKERMKTKKCFRNI